MPTRTTDELIVYSNSRNGLGIRILGAKRATYKSGIYIKQLLDNGLAQRDGRLKVGDQILSINDEIATGINRETAIRILRSAAATNQVHLHIRHFLPPLSSNEYQKLLFDEKFTDDDDNHRIPNSNHFRNTSATTTDEIQIRRSSRKHRKQQQEQDRHNTYDYGTDQHQQYTNDRNLTTSDISQHVLQSLLNSKFNLIDLVDLLKKTYPYLLSNDQKKELQFIQQLSETNSDGRITLKDFERQANVLLGENINLLPQFYNSSSNRNDDKLLIELRREIASCHSIIDELKNKILTCERSQRLSKEVEMEYEDLLKFLDEQLRQYKLNEINQLKQIRANDQLIDKLFHYLSVYITKPNDQHILSELKYEYQQQQKFLPSNYQPNNNQYPQHL